MKKKTKRWLLCILAVSAIGIVAINMLAYIHAHAMMHFTSGGSPTSKPETLTCGQKVHVLLMGVNVPRPKSDRHPSDLDPECRRVSIRCPDGVTLGGWYTNRGERTPLVVLFHGYSAEKTSLLQEAKTFLELGASGAAG